MNRITCPKTSLSYSANTFITSEERKPLYNEQNNTSRKLRYSEAPLYYLPFGWFFSLSRTLSDTFALCGPYISSSLSKRQISLASSEMCLGVWLRATAMSDGTGVSGERGRVRSCHWEEEEEGTCEGVREVKSLSQYFVQNSHDIVHIWNAL